MQKQMQGNWGSSLDRTGTLQELQGSLEGYNFTLTDVRRPEARVHKQVLTDRFQLVSASRDPFKISNCCRQAGQGACCG